MNPRIRVAVIDDHPLFREGVVQIISACLDLEVIAQGASAKEAVAIAQSSNPDIFVLDISIPGGGIAALEAIVADHPESKVLMLTVSINQTDVVRALRLGAHGYVVKGASGPELIQALRSVSHGDQYLSPTLGARLLSDVFCGKAVPKSDASSSLSSREAQILSLVKQGLSNKAIGAKLQLSDKTIKHYMTNLFHKLHVRNRVEAALLVQNEQQDHFQADADRSEKEKRRMPERI